MSVRICVQPQWYNQRISEIEQPSLGRGSAPTPRISEETSGRGMEIVVRAIGAAVMEQPGFGKVSTAIPQVSDQVSNWNVKSVASAQGSMAASK